jgi:capsular polysaccharide biosynthesis protein
VRRPAPAALSLRASGRRGGRLVEVATAVGWPSDRATRDFLTQLDEFLARRARPRVAVLAERSSGGVADVVRAAYPRARVWTFGAELDPSALHAGLAARGRFDAVVDERPVEPYVTRFRDALFHLRDGGGLVVLFPHPGKAAARGPQAFAAEVLRYLTEPVPAPQANNKPTEAVKDRRALARAVRRLTVGRRHVLATNRVPALAKMREHEMDQVLALREGRSGRVLARIPKADLVSRCELRENSDRRDPRMAPVFSVPPLSLREYSNVLCAPYQVAVQRNLLLPDTYRHNQALRLRNHATRDLAEGFAALRHDVGSPEPLAGTYFYLDTEWPAHFGHLLTEQLSRTWALPQAREAFPDLKALVSRRPGQPELFAFERGLLAAGGLAEDEIVLVHGPVRVERLVAATPMFSAPRYVHPDIAGLWRTVGDALVKTAGDEGHPKKIFCSRRVQRRACRNAPEVEALFAARGFTVIFPEDFSIGEQARIFREADVVAGFAGSGMLNLMFTEAPVHAIALAPESYAARNEYLVCSVLGHRLDMVWSQPTGRDESGYVFDLAREGIYLERILDSL